MCDLSSVLTFKWLQTDRNDRQSFCGTHFVLKRREKEGDNNISNVRALRLATRGRVSRAHPLQKAGPTKPSPMEQFQMEQTRKLSSESVSEGRAPRTFRIGRECEKKSVLEMCVCVCAEKFLGKRGVRCTRQQEQKSQQIVNAMKCKPGREHKGGR